MQVNMPASVCIFRAAHTCIFRLSLQFVKCGWVCVPFIVSTFFSSLFVVSYAHDFFTCVSDCVCRRIVSAMFPLPTCSVTSCCFAPTGWLLLTGSTSGDIILFDCFKKTSVARILRADELGVNAIQVGLSL